jgi:hypothetical protein
MAQHGADQKIVLSHVITIDCYIRKLREEKPDRPKKIVLDNIYSV